jgi:hypothetical protein
VTDLESSELLRMVLSGELDPLVAAERVVATGPFFFGQIGIGVELAQASPSEALRFQAFMGRLTWSLFGGAGLTGLTEPATLEEYREFFVRSMALLDEPDRAP